MTVKFKTEAMEFMEKYSKEEWSEEV